MLQTKKTPQNATVNAGSMADIAFLLLIFFLVTTTIETNEGILARLPPWEYIEEPAPMLERNVLRIKINAHNELLVEGKRIHIGELRFLTKEFIHNPNNSRQLAVSPKAAVISLQNDRGTDYQTYLSVYNELKASYTELREAHAQKAYQSSYENLSKLQQKTIRNQYPMIISEAEPTDYE